MDSTSFESVFRKEARKLERGSSRRFYPLALSGPNCTIDRTFSLEFALSSVKH